MEETVELPKKKRSISEAADERRRRYKETKAAYNKAFWDKIPENGVVLLTLSHIWRFNQEDDDEKELASNETQVFKIPTRKFKPYVLEYLEEQNLAGEITACQIWIDLEIRLTHMMGLDKEADEEEIRIRGGSLLEYEWSHEKGPLVTPKDTVTHAFCIEC